MRLAPTTKSEERVKVGSVWRDKERGSLWVVRTVSTHARTGQHLITYSQSGLESLRDHLVYSREVRDFLNLYTLERE